MAELAVFFHFDPVGIILLILHGVVISLLAILACHYDFDSHL